MLKNLLNTRFFKGQIMRNHFTIFLGVIVMLSCFGYSVSFGQEKSQTTQRVDLLWPDGAPDAKGDSDGDKPTLTIFLPDKDKAVGSAVLICPGGGYQHVTMDYEGCEVAQWLNSLGIAGFVLNYRHNGVGYHYPAPLQDAQRAIRTIRYNAKDWGIDPDRIGILGFSAGGHLASTAGTHFNENSYPQRDPIDKLSPRPDFMILIYPVISMTAPYGHVGSRTNLLGENPDEKLAESLSSEKQVTPQTPPTFLVHGSDDTAVPVENSVLFYLALKKAAVPAELHIYEHGQHGFGLNRGKGPVSNWPQQCANWLKARGLCDKTTK
jgi:acetyl esterase/lipase